MHSRSESTQSRGPTCTAQRCTVGERRALEGERALLPVRLGAVERVARRVEINESNGSLSKEGALQ